MHSPHASRAGWPGLLLQPHVVAGFLLAWSFIIALVPMSPDYLNPDFPLQNSLANGSLGRQLQLLFLLLLAVWQCLRHPAVSLDILKHSNPFLLLVLLYCLASTLWSPYPFVTLKRGIVLGILIVIGLATPPPLGGSRQLIRTLLTTLSLLCFLSLLVALAFPDIGTDPVLDHAWRGITWHKNQLGNAAAYAMLLWLYEWTRRDLDRRLCAAGMLLSLFILVMARSSTALLMTALSCAVYLYGNWSWLRKTRIDLVLMLGGLVLLILFLHFHFIATGRMPTWQDLTGPVAGLFGKGTDLTGRTNIWHLVWFSVQQHFLLGIGYGAFWLGVGGPAQYIGDALFWMPNHAHNGYLDILNELGVVGLVLFMLALLWHLGCLLRLMRHDRREATLHLAIFSIIAVSNLTETDFLSGTLFQNLMLLYSMMHVSARLARARRAPPHRHAPPPRDAAAAGRP